MKAKGSLTLLSASILMALAGSGLEKRAVASEPEKALHASRPYASRSGNNVASTSPRPLFHGVGNGTGSTILYSQHPSWDTYGVPATNFSNGAYGAEVADDFTVGSEGWTITGFNFDIYSSDGGSPAVNNAPADIYVYPDAGGAPAVAPVCATFGNTNNPVAGTTSATVAQITLNTPCAVPQGTYWVGVQFDTAGTVYYVRTLFGAQVNAEAHFQSGDPNSSCHTWQTIGTCFGHSSYGPGYDLPYDVVGVEGIAPPDGSLSLSLTLALDNGDPSQCGTASSLSVSAGDPVNFCYTVTNGTGHDLDYQTLSDTLGGTLLSFSNQSLPDGATLQYNRIAAAGPSTQGAVIAAWTAQDSLPGYSFDNAGASNFVDITSTGVALAAQETVLMPFSFSFYGTTTNVLAIGTEGIYVGVAGAVVPGWFGAPTLPGDWLAGPAMLPYWSNEIWTPQTGGVGGIYVETLGAAPNRRFVVEWFNMYGLLGSGGSTENATFETIIDEATGQFSYEYQDVDCGGCATYPLIGAQMQSNLANVYFSANQNIRNPIQDGLSIVWTPNVVEHSSQATGIASLDVGAPVVAVSPGALHAAADPGGTATANLSIANSGNRDLTWTVDETPGTAGARAHFPTNPYRAPKPPADKLDVKRALPAASRSEASGSAASVDQPAGYIAIPAYGWGYSSYEAMTYYSFDAANPGSMSSISTTPPEYTGLSEVDGGSFANNDFGTEYLNGYDSVTGASRFAKVDTTTGLVTIINPSLSVAHSGEIILGLRWDASTSTMYAFGAWNPTSDSIASYLYTIDLSTGDLHPVGEADDVLIESVAFDQAGHMYGLDTAGDQLIAIDKSTGDWQGVGPLGVSTSGAQGMDFDPRTGTLWWAGLSFPDPFSYVSELYTIDVATGTATEYAPIENNREVTAFDIAVPETPCYEPGDVPWLSISPNSGTVVAGDVAGQTTVTFDATGLSSGTYSANVCVHSNDRSHQVVSVPVTFIVNAPAVSDTIFADGFESPGSGGTAQNFTLDDGSYENSIGLSDGTNEEAALWLNRFTLGSDQYPLDLQNVQVEWPSGHGDPTGLQARVVVYYDADGDGDPANAVLLYEGFVTIGGLDVFETYPVSATIPGAGDIYVGFEDYWAEGGYLPLIYPAAIDTSSASHMSSWVVADSGGAPDVDNLAYNSMIGVIDDLAGLPGNWLIRANGQTPSGKRVALRP